MAPVQNTFSIIPNFPSANNTNDDSTTKASRPPMTTKQAKKAYQKANRGPKLSKAEIRRQELLEQDRIRKEAEKERNQARARAARDRKKEKEDNERAEKKKKGLPLINVRPSQDTIARFVRGFGAPKNVTNKPREPSPVQSPLQSPTRSPMQSPVQSPVHTPVRPTLEAPCREPIKETEKCESSASQRSERVEHNESRSVEDDETSQPSPKRRRLSLSVTAPKSPLDGSDWQLASKLKASSPETSSCPLQTPVRQGSIPREGNRSQPAFAPLTLSQEVNDIVDILNDDYLNDSFSSIFASPEIERNAENTSTKACQGTPAKSPSATPLRSSPGSQKASRPSKQTEDPSAASQGLAQNTKSSPSSFRKPLCALSAAAINAKTSLNATTLSGNKDLAISIKADVHRPEDQLHKSRFSPMGPPPLPPKPASRAIDVSGLGQKGKASPSSIKKTSTAKWAGPSGRPAIRQVSDYLPPPSTQAFVLSHLDELFPSPTQEMKELYDESKPVSVFADSGGSIAANPTRQTTERIRKPHLLSPGKVGWKTPKMDRSSKPKGTACGVRACSPTADAPKVQATSPVLDFPFLSTQDVFLSAQDVEELETPVSALRQDHGTVYECTGSRSYLPGTMQKYETSLKQQNQTKLADVKDQRHAADIDLIHDSIGRPGFSSSVTPRHLVPELTQQASLTAIRNGSGSPIEKKNCGDYDSSGNAVLKSVKQASECFLHEDAHARTPGRTATSQDAESEPFFTSSCREPLYKYAIERSKTNSWGDRGARLQIEAGLDQLQRLENERFASLLQDTEHFNELLPEETALAITANGEKQRSSARAAMQSQDLRKQTINNGSKVQNEDPRSSLRSISKGKDGRPSPKLPRPLSSYEKMLAELDKTKHTDEETTQPLAGETEPSGSQETDYGDLGWDDEMLAMNI